MKKAPIILSWIALSSVPVTAIATQPVGIYGVIERVVFEPATGEPNRIQVWGAFSIVKDRSTNAFHDPARGCLYFRPKSGDEATVRKEWNDLKAMAATGKVVAFGNRFEQKITLRKEGEKLDEPDVYTSAIGVREISKDNEYPPIRKLVKLVSQTSPIDGEEVEPGKVTLHAKGQGGKEHPSAKVRFEIEETGGAKEASEPIAQSGKETSWTPKMELQAGKKYAWRVWAVDGDWTGPSTRSSLNVKAAR
jgi:hypothetical protein